MAGCTGGPGHACAAPGRRGGSGVGRAAAGAGGGDRVVAAGGAGAASGAGAIARRGGGAGLCAGRTRAAQCLGAVADRRGGRCGQARTACPHRAPPGAARAGVAAPAAQRRTGRIESGAHRCAGGLLRRLPARTHRDAAGAAADPDRGVFGRLGGGPGAAADRTADSVFHDAGGLGRRSRRARPAERAGADGRALCRSPQGPGPAARVWPRRGGVERHCRRGRRRARALAQGAAHRLPVVYGAGILRLGERGDRGAVLRPDLSGHARSARLADAGRGHVLPAAGAGILCAVAAAGGALPRPCQCAGGGGRSRAPAGRIRAAIGNASGDGAALARTGTGAGTRPAAAGARSRATAAGRTAHGGRAFR